jgi:hypothetical protein
MYQPVPKPSPGFCGPRTALSSHSAIAIAIAIAIASGSLHRVASTTTIKDQTALNGDDGLLAIACEIDRATRWDAFHYWLFRAVLQDSADRSLNIELRFS